MQERRDSRLSDVLEAVRGMGSGVQGTCVLSERSHLWLHPAPSADWLLMSSILERSADTHTCRMEQHHAYGSKL